MKEYFKDPAAEEIPADEDDDICAIVRRYFLFAQRMKPSAEDTLQGLEEIFPE